MVLQYFVDFNLSIEVSKKNFCEYLKTNIMNYTQFIHLYINIVHLLYGE